MTLVFRYPRAGSAEEALPHVGAWRGSGAPSLQLLQESIRGSVAVALTGCDALRASVIWLLCSSGRVRYKRPFRAGNVRGLR
jgi:hypothetical protein